MEVVRPTLLAAATLDYPHARITVLDDGRSDELKALAEHLGFAYSARERRHFAKSGNLNHGLAITSAPFVLALDADHVPHPEIIDRLVGFFQVPTIGLVSSRQEVLEAFCEYAEAQLATGFRLNQMTRHIMGLFRGIPGARGWRRYLSEHMHLPGAGVDVIRDAVERIEAD